MSEYPSVNYEEPDAATVELLKCAFPSGLGEEEYFPLLYILRKDMTIRAASSLVGILLSKNYLDIYNDALGVNNQRNLDPAIVEDLTTRLDNCGYRDWLDS